MARNGKCISPSTFAGKWHLAIGMAERFSIRHHGPMQETKAEEEEEKRDGAGTLRKPRRDN